MNLKTVHPVFVEIFLSKPHTSAAPDEKSEDHMGTINICIKISCPSIQMLSRYLSLDESDGPTSQETNTVASRAMMGTDTLMLCREELCHSCVNSRSLRPSEFISCVTHCTVTVVSGRLARGAAVQELEYLPILWNNFLSFRGGLHTAWWSVGFKASEAFHSVSFPPWNPWISHITSYCPCRAAAHLAAACHCPQPLIWPYGCATVSTCPALSKRLFPCLFFFFLSYLTPGKLNSEIRVQWNCHPL